MRDVIASGRRPWRRNPHRGKVTLARLRLEWQSSQVSVQFMLGALGFFLRDQFTALQSFCRWSLTGTRSFFHETKI